MTDSIQSKAATSFGAHIMRGVNKDFEIGRWVVQLKKLEAQIPEEWVNNNEKAKIKNFIQKQKEIEDVVNKVKEKIDANIDELIKLKKSYMVKADLITSAGKELTTQQMEQGEKVFSEALKALNNWIRLSNENLEKWQEKFKNGDVLYCKFDENCPKLKLANEILNDSFDQIAFFLTTLKIDDSEGRRRKADEEHGSNRGKDTRLINRVQSMRDNNRGNVGYCGSRPSPDNYNGKGSTLNPSAATLSRLDRVTTVKDQPGSEGPKMTESLFSAETLKNFDNLKEFPGVLAPFDIRSVAKPKTKKTGGGGLLATGAKFFGAL